MLAPWSQQHSTARNNRLTTTTTDSNFQFPSMKITGETRAATVTPPVFDAGASLLKDRLFVHFTSRSLTSVVSKCGAKRPCRSCECSGRNKSPFYNECCKTQNESSGVFKIVTKRSASAPTAPRSTCAKTFWPIDFLTIEKLHDSDRMLKEHQTVSFRTI